VTHVLFGLELRGGIILTITKWTWGAVDVH